MKKATVRILALLLMLVMGVSCFSGCSSLGKTLMYIEDTEMSVNLYRFYLSRAKGVLCSSYVFGEDALYDSFWDKVRSEEEAANGYGTVTYNEYYTNSILENTKTYLAAMYEFDKRGLELPKETVDEIDARIDEFIRNDAGGSKTQFNAILSEYGANYNILREAYIIEAKIEYLKDVIYGKDGQSIDKGLMDYYYNENYRRFKQIFFVTSDFVFETDANGDDIYYTSDGKIAYDKGGVQKTDGAGNPVRDANGDVIYLIEGTSKISYDKFNGERRHKTDEKGNRIVEKFEDGSPELQAVLANVESTRKKTANGDYEGFEKLLDSNESYPNGYYITESSNTDYPEVVEAVFEMEVGEVRVERSEYGYHIVMRYDLEVDGYTKNDNSDFFISTATGNYVFLDDLKNRLLSADLEKHKSKIVLDAVLLEGVDMKSVAPNYYY